MQESTAALWAAVIGAGAAILVGGLAFWAAMRQVRRTAVTQREQSFWQSRRDTYAKMMLALQNADRANNECLAAFHEGDFADSHQNKAVEAAHKIDEVRFVLILEAPQDPVFAHAVRVANRKASVVTTGLIAWRRDALLSSPLRTSAIWE
ncbi:hypothetical protein [Streptomyces violaceusniger]|uniref:hypothetical protein n=1 Tax=Streptomyces violaceusniger TaxID=68280 RepID=UPI003825D748